jgi:hypothetical protein
VNGATATNGNTDHSVKQNGSKFQSRECINRYIEVADFEKLPHHIEKARFFVIKSYSEEDVHKVISVELSRVTDMLIGDQA